MKCIKIRKYRLKLLPEMSGLTNAIHYPTWRQLIKFLSQGKYSFNQSHKTTFLMYQYSNKKLYQGDRWEEYNVCNTLEYWKIFTCCLLT